MVLRGVRVLELDGLAPVPFAGMVLGDFGADVYQIKRPGAHKIPALNRGKKSIELDLKNESHKSILWDMIKKSDVLLDPYRPGVLDKLGFTYEAISAVNPRIIVAHLTGYGQTGPCKFEAGHDINYLSLSGALSFLGKADGPPTPPVNLVADFAGGGMMAALGVVMALFEREKSGLGQVVDAAMVDGSAYVSSFLFDTKKIGFFDNGRGKNLLDLGAPHYNVYECLDGKFISVGCLEPQFFAAFINIFAQNTNQSNGEKLRAFSPLSFSPLDNAQWEEYYTLFCEVFKTKNRDDWVDLFKGSDSCVTPVLETKEAFEHPQNIARDLFRDGAVNPAPKLSRTPGVANKSIESSPEEILEFFGIKAKL